jgi:hypothetical protein
VVAGTFGAGAYVMNTSLTNPILIGGTTTTSTLTLRSTSGVGAAGADIIFQTGNNGATEAMRILNSGFVGIGTTGPIYKFDTAVSVAGDWVGRLYNSSATGYGVIIRGGATDGSTQALQVQNQAGTGLMVVLGNGNVGIGTTSPTAVLHLKAGTATLNTAPLKFNTGTLLTTAEAGAVEFLTDAYYGTITTGAARKTFAFLESPSFTTPALGVATATSINSLTITTSTGTLTITNAKTLSVSNTLTLAGTDATTMTFPTTSATIARTDAGQTFTGVNVFTSPKIITEIDDTNGNKLIAITATGSAVNYVKLTNAATGTAGASILSEGETNIDLQIGAKGTGKIHNKSGTYQDIQTYTPAAAATATLDLSLANIHHITMPAGNITIALSNGVAGQCFIIRILQDGVGGRTVTWFTTIKWAGGSAPTLTTTASKADTLGFEITGTNTYDGFVVGANI